MPATSVRREPVHAYDLFDLDWELIGVYAVLLAILLASGVVIRAARKWRTSLRVTVKAVTWPIAILSALLLGIELLVPGRVTKSPAVFSPDRSKAARVRTADEGATGGDSTVDIFSNHGFSYTQVYWGEWESVGDQDLHWVSNSGLQITRRTDVSVQEHVYGDCSLYCALIWPCFPQGHPRMRHKMVV